MLNARGVFVAEFRADPLDTWSAVDGDPRAGDFDGERVSLLVGVGVPVVCSSEELVLVSCWL